MLQPKRVKYRKVHLGRLRGKASAGNTLAFGDYGLQAQEVVWLTARQIEAGRRAITHHLSRGGQVWVRVFPQKSVTDRPPETRMGGGKGNPDYWAAAVKRGHIIFEIAGVEENLAREAFRLASHKLPLSTRVVVKEQAPS